VEEALLFPVDISQRPVLAKTLPQRLKHDSRSIEAQGCMRDAPGLFSYEI